MLGTQACVPPVDDGHQGRFWSRGFGDVAATCLWKIKPALLSIGSSPSTPQTRKCFLTLVVLVPVIPAGCHIRWGIMVENEPEKGARSRLEVVFRRGLREGDVVASDPL